MKVNIDEPEAQESGGGNTPIVVIAVILVLAAIGAFFWWVFSPSSAPFTVQTDVCVYDRDFGADHGAKINAATVTSTSTNPHCKNLAETFLDENRYIVDLAHETGGVGYTVIFRTRVGNRLFADDKEPLLDAWKFYEDGGNDVRRLNFDNARIKFKDLRAAFIAAKPVQQKVVVIGDVTGGWGKGAPADPDGALTEQVRKTIDDSHDVCGKGNAAVLYVHRITNTDYQGGEPSVNLCDRGAVKQAEDTFLAPIGEDKYSAVYEGLKAVIAEQAGIAKANPYSKTVLHIYTDGIQNAEGGISFYNTPELLDDWTTLDAAFDLTETLANGSTRRLDLRGFEIHLHKVPTTVRDTPIMQKSFRYLAARLTQHGAKVTIEDM